MRLSPDHMFDRFTAADPAYDGRFFTGIATTGIYCLASCHARKPKRANVRFFPSVEAARAAGFRACRKCHPDDFARGADPVLESIEALAGEVRAQPARFKDVRAVVRRSGFGSTRVFELFRQHYHCTPAELLLRARLDRTRRDLLETGHSLAQVAGDAGFESLSVLHAHFREKYGLTPAAYRALRTATTFTLTLPPGYPLAHLRRALSRDPHAVNERWIGDRYQVAVSPGVSPSAAPAGRDTTSGRTRLAAVSAASDQQDLAPRPNRPMSDAAILNLDFTAAPEVTVSMSPGDSVRAHALAIGVLGLEQDAASFARLARRLGFARLVEGRPQLRVTQTVSVFEGLLWAIIGQQINLPFAFTLRRRLFELAGQAVAAAPNGDRLYANGDRLYAAPSPAAVAALTAEQLRGIQFSRQKADYLLNAARLIAEGKLDLEGLRDLSATRAERTLLAVRGLGPWSVNYMMMRALGHADCIPLGDTGVTSGLKHLFQLEDRPDADATRRLMQVFSPHRSLATAHLWQLLQSAP